MGRVLTNNVGLIYAIEDTENDPDNIGFIAGETGPGGPIAGTPEWFQTEPNDINQFGATISKTPRDPISKNRQRRKGTTTDLDSAVEFPADITLSSFEDFIEGFCFARAVNRDMDIDSTSVAGPATNDYTVPSLSAAQAAKLNFSTGEFATLIVGRGHANSENNGLQQLDTDASATDTALSVVGPLVTETPPANADVELAGIRFLDGTTDLTYNFSGVTGTLTVGGGIVGFDWTTLGITVGQQVHFGSPDANGDPQNAFQNVSANDQYGVGRVTAITATVLTVDKLDTAMQNDAPTVPATLDVLWGKFVRNVPTDDPDYLERSFQFEGEFPNLGTGGADEYQYAKGNFCSTVQFELPLTDKATATFAFVGTDTDNPTTTRKANAGSAEAPNGTTAFNTSSDIARLRITKLDESGLSTDFKNLTLELDNNVSPEKVLGVLGARFINAGNFFVNTESQLLFTNGEVIDAIRDNETITLDFIIKNEDASIGVDIPSATLGGGDREFPRNESVLINTTGEAFGDPILNTSIGVSIFPVRLPD